MEHKNKQTIINKDIGYGPVDAILVTLGTFFGAQLIIGQLISALPSILGWEATRINLLFEQSVVARFGMIFAIEAITLCLLWLFLQSRNVSRKAIGLVRPEIRDISYAILGYAAYFVLFIVVSVVAKAAVPELNLQQEQQIGFSRGTGGAMLWLIFISLVILPPITEEILMRGFLYTGLRSKLPKLIAALVTSALFAAAHLQWRSGNALLWVAALDTFTLSMILVYLRDKTGSLWSPILVHMIKNGLAFVLLFVFKVV